MQMAFERHASNKGFKKNCISCHILTYLANRAFDRQSSILIQFISKHW